MYQIIHVMSCKHKLTNEHISKFTYKAVNNNNNFIFFVDSYFPQEAIEKGGFVEARISKVLVQGPAQVGKTSVKCLLLSQVYDKDKPYSTGIAERPLIAFQNFGKTIG